MFERAVDHVLRKAAALLSFTRRHAALFGFIILSAAINCAIARTGQNTWLEFVALVPLFWSIRSGNARLACVCGALWGGTIALCAACGLDLPMSITAVSAALLIAAPAIYAAIGALLTRSIGFSPLVLAVAWTGVELLQSQLGLRSALTTSVYEHSALLDAIARTFGYVLIAFTITYLNAAMLSLVTIACGNVGNLSRRILRSPPLSIVGNSSFEAARSFLRLTTRSRAPPRGPHITIVANP
ncbi:MAG: hypothetical protein HY287_14090 [Planctomycetes bacterium]|nr:hypothetical protein [Planctomycetota bacterium]